MACSFENIAVRFELWGNYKKIVTIIGLMKKFRMFIEKKKRVN